jgi:GTP-binding protein
MGKVVAIVGRPNVGKSTLFNRLIGERKAIVDDVSGVTRDRHYGTAEWTGREFTVIDTGGYVTHSDDVFEGEIRSQVKIAIDEAHILLFMVDVTCGITDLDTEFANLLRKSKKPVFLIVNKVDNHDRLLDSNEFYGLGFKEIFTLSSVSGSGTGELLDAVVKELGDEPEAEPETDVPKVAVVGKPNVGKSSLINALLGENRNIVTDIPGTTRDSIHTRYNVYNKEMLIIDTAGIRKKAKVKEDIEFYSVMRSITALEECDVVVIMVDATVGVESQDVNLLTLAARNGKGIVLLVNKWDLVEKDTRSSDEFSKEIRETIAPFNDIPILFTSVVNKQRIFKAVETIFRVYENRRRKISTSEINEVMQEIIAGYPPPAIKGKYVKIKYVTQLPVYPPTFLLFCNLPQYVKDAYKRFLENKLREKYDFEGVPIKLFFRKK